MTAYFDAKHTELRKVGEALIAKESLENHKALEEFESTLVYDVSVASEMPDFPVDLRNRINRLVLKHGIASQPVNGKGPEIETIEEHIETLHKLVWDLHTIFHDLAKKNLVGFSDDPRMPLRVLFGQSEARREALVENPDAKDEEDEEDNHVDDFINMGYLEPELRKKEPHIRYAQWLLLHKRLPAWQSAEFSQFLGDHRLYCTYKGKRYQVTTASRLGDVGLTTDFKRDAGYELRVNVKECSDWGPKP